ncbi:pepsin/retropepsin-like aspartic protease family protein [Niabella drilacis]|uniref:Aspartyl protease n=1 Tax=Niabella drilacis (strain DSM 25811 / CCM 8410 / CCUG 62505 / LMG 26954 / E90) TaxID=1285928 RepID=A0A1G6R543_NIADE|nr:hypothetical protein [Niabella drilacis]SDC99225.1 hypothetical protein SAMN04487894_105132 [Niabella drilacis]
MTQPNAVNCRAHFTYCLLLLFFFSCTGNSRPEVRKDITPPLIGKNIPFIDTLSGNHIIVEVLINKRPVRLLLDNGTHPDYSIILFKPSAARIGIIDTLKSFRLETDRIDTTLFKVSISSFEDTMRRVQVQDYHNLPASKLPDGILGFGFLKKFIVLVNYEQRYVQILDTAKFSAPGGYGEINFEPPFNGIFRNLKATFSMGGLKLAEPINLDLGCARPGFSFSNFFYKKYKNVFQGASTGTQSKAATMVKGTTNLNILLDSVSLYGNLITNLSSSVELTEGTHVKSIIFGSDVLRHLKKIYFHFGANKMYIPVAGLTQRQGPVVGVQ